MPGEREGIDGLTRWLGLSVGGARRVRLTIRPELINPAGLLAGPVAYAMVDYSMGSVLWQARSKGEAVATIGISINYVQTAREGDVVGTSSLDRRNDRVAILESEVRTGTAGCWRARSAASRSSPARGWAGTSAARRHPTGLARKTGIRFSGWGAPK